MKICNSLVVDKQSSRKHVMMIHNHSVKTGEANFKNCSFFHSPKWLLILIIISAAFYLILNISFLPAFLLIISCHHIDINFFLSYLQYYYNVRKRKMKIYKYKLRKKKNIFLQKPNFLFSLVSFSVEMFLFFQFSFSFNLLS